MKWKPGDICITTPRYTAACYVVMDAVEGNPDSCLALSTKERGQILPCLRPRRHNTPVRQYINSLGRYRNRMLKMCRRLGV